MQREPGALPMQRAHARTPPTDLHDGPEEKRAVCEKRWQCPGTDLSENPANPISVTLVSPSLSPAAAPLPTQDQDKQFPPSQCFD
jgi:hypothetical protein